MPEERRQVANRGAGLWIGEQGSAKRVEETDMKAEFISM